MSNYKQATHYNYGGDGDWSKSTYADCCQLHEKAYATDRSVQSAKSCCGDHVFIRNSERLCGGAQNRQKELEILP